MKDTVKKLIFALEQAEIQKSLNQTTAISTLGSTLNMTDKAQTPYVNRMRTNPN